MTTRKNAETHQGPEAVWRFEHTMGKILSVSKDELSRREAEHIEANQHKARRGRKPNKK